MGSESSKPVGRVLTPTMYRKNYKKPAQSPSPAPIIIRKVENVEKSPKSNTIPLVERQQKEEHRSSPIFSSVFKLKDKKHQESYDYPTYRSAVELERYSPSEDDYENTNYRLKDLSKGESIQIVPMSSHDNLLVERGRKPLMIISTQNSIGSAGSSEIEHNPAYALANLKRHDVTTTTTLPSSYIGAKGNHHNYSESSKGSKSGAPVKYYSTETKVEKSKLGPTTTVQMTTLERETSSEITYSPIFHGQFTCSGCNHIWSSRLARENVPQRCVKCRNSVFPTK